MPMESVVPTLYASAPEAVPFGPSLEIRAFLLQRERGNLLIYRAETLKRERCLLRQNLRLGRRLAERLERVRFRRRDLQRHFAWKDRRNLLARHVTNMCRLLGLEGEAVEYVVVLVACHLDDFADEDSVGADDIPALLDLQPRDRISHARSTPDQRAETSPGWTPPRRQSRSRAPSRRHARPHACRT